MPGWDNLNNVPLKSRSWDATKLQYTSTLSYADMNVIYSVHPKNKKTYFVILNKAAGVNLQGKSVDSVYSVDELFQQKADVTSDFTQSNGYLYLKSDTNVGKGFILTLKTGSTPITPPPVNPPVTPPPTNKTNTTSATCSDTDGGNNTFTKGTVYGKDSSGKNYSYTDTCFMNGNTAMIIEYYCSNSKYKNGNYTCNNGCANNACIPDATTTTATCSDSDGGDNIYTKGIIVQEQNINQQIIHATMGVQTMHV